MPIDTPRAAQRNESFWQISWPPSCFRSIARIFPGYGAANETCCLPDPLIGEDGHEQALTRNQALAGAEQRAHHAAPLLLAAVAEDGLHLDARRHVHHRPGLCDRALARIELHFDELHLAADDAEIDFVRAAARHDRRRRRRRGRLVPPVRKAASCGTSFSGVQLLIPAPNTSVLPSIVPFLRFVITSSWDTGPTWWPPMAMYHCCCDICFSAPAGSLQPPAGSERASDAAPRKRCVLPRWPPPRTLPAASCRLPASCLLRRRRCAPRRPSRASAPLPGRARAGEQAAPDRYVRRPTPVRPP